MDSIKPKPVINVLEFSNQALDDINRLIKNEKDQFAFDDEIEIILGITKSGNLVILEGDSQKRYLAINNCSAQKFELKASSNPDGFAVREEVLVNDDDPIVRDLTSDRKVKAMVTVGINLFAEYGCLQGHNGSIYWCNP